MQRTILAVFSIILLVTAAKAQQFEPGCPQFFGQLRTLRHHQTIDSQCPRQGEGSSDSNAQNRAKNNFCAGNQPVEVSIALLRQLEGVTEAKLTAAHIPFGSTFTIPPNRNRLTQGFNIGNQHFSEGMAVFIRAFVLDAHHSNVRKGENVNCNTKGKRANDIHIALGTSSSADPCNSITAEISPHFRPDVWDTFDDYEMPNPVMIFGQLFYDASHLPCQGGVRRSPARTASWEIHPVYSIFICKNASPQACPSNDMSKWVPFDQWVNLPDDLVKNRPFSFLNFGIDKNRYLTSLLRSVS